MFTVTSIFYCMKQFYDRIVCKHKVAQVAAYELGVPLDTVMVQRTSSITSSNSQVTGGSITSEVNCQVSFVSSLLRKSSKESVRFCLNQFVWQLGSFPSLRVFGTSSYFFLTDCNRVLQSSEISHWPRSIKAKSRHCMEGCHCRVLQWKRGSRLLMHVRISLL